MYFLSNSGRTKGKIRWGGLEPNALSVPFRRSHTISSWRLLQFAILLIKKNNETSTNNRNILYGRKSYHYYYSVQSNTTIYITLCTLRLCKSRAMFHKNNLLDVYVCELCYNNVPLPGAALLNWNPQSYSTDIVNSFL